MSKLADFDTPESRVAVCVEELKEVAKENKLTPEIIDVIAAPYMDMERCYGLTVFARDYEKIDRIVNDLVEPDEIDIKTETLMEQFDKAGIDYILGGYV